MVGKIISIIVIVVLFANCHLSAGLLPGKRDHAVDRETLAPDGKKLLRLTEMFRDIVDEAAAITTARKTGQGGEESLARLKAIIFVLWKVNLTDLREENTDIIAAREEYQELYLIDRQDRKIYVLTCIAGEFYLEEVAEKGQDSKGRRSFLMSFIR